MTFRLQVKHGTVKYLPPKSESKLIVDWDSFLHSYWLEKMAGSNSTFYDDAKVSHGNGCPCCSNTSVWSRNLSEVRKIK